MLFFIVVFTGVCESVQRSVPVYFLVINDPHGSKVGKQSPGCWKKSKNLTLKVSPTSVITKHTVWFDVLDRLWVETGIRPSHTPILRLSKSYLPLISCRCMSHLSWTTFPIVSEIYKTSLLLRLVVVLGILGGKGAPPRIKWPRGLNREVYASRYRVSVEITWRNQGGLQLQSVGLLFWGKSISAKHKPRRW